MLPALHVALRFVRLKRLFRGLERVLERPVEQDAAERAAIVRQVRSAVALAACHGLTRGSCLSRSTSVWWLLRRRGVPAELRIGVRKYHRELKAHAWVECQGLAVNDSARRVQAYAAFPESLTR